MTIIAKIVSDDFTVRSVELPNVPSDNDIIRALGGEDGEDIFTFGGMAGYDVIRLFDGREKMVIGNAAYLKEPQRARITCAMPDERVVDLIKYLQSGWEDFGFVSA